MRCGRWWPRPRAGVGLGDAPGGGDAQLLEYGHGLWAAGDGHDVRKRRQEAIFGHAALDLRQQMAQADAGHEDHHVDLSADDVIGEIDGLLVGLERHLAQRRADRSHPPRRSIMRVISSARRLSKAATRNPAKLGVSVGMSGFERGSTGLIRDGTFRNFGGVARGGAARLMLTQAVKAQQARPRPGILTWASRAGGRRLESKPRRS